MYNHFGKELRTFTELKEGWGRKDLYNALMQNIKDSISASINLQKYKYFYLKIYGDYDKNIVSDFSPCACCPKNPEYYRYDSYNEILDNKISVLVLKSKYPDFRSYKVECSYYIDDIDENKKHGFEIYAVKKSIVEQCASKIAKLFF